MTQKCREIGLKVEKSKKTNDWIEKKTEEDTIQK